MNTPNNLTDAVLYATIQNWWIIILVIIIPIGYSILMKKFEKWLKTKIKNSYQKKKQ